MALLGTAFITNNSKPIEIYHNNITNLFNWNFLYCNKLEIVGYKEITLLIVTIVHNKSGSY